MGSRCDMAFNAHYCQKFILINGEKRRFGKRFEFQPDQEWRQSDKKTIPRKGKIYNHQAS